MRTSKTWLVIGISVILVAATLAVLAATSFFTPSSSSTVRVGYLTADLHHIAYFVAKNKTVGNGQSLFEKYGVNVTDAASGGYASGAHEMDAFAGGKVDIGFMGAPPSITKHINGGVNTTVLAQVNDIGSALVVRKSINSLAELRGKTVAVPSRGSIQFFLLLFYAEQNNVDIGDITIIEVSPGLMKLQMISGYVDGFIAWEPFPTDAALDTTADARILATSTDIWPNHLDCVVVADKTFAAQNPVVVVNFLKAYIEATDWLNNAKVNPTSADYELLVQIGVDFTLRSPSVIREALNNINYKYSLDSAFLYTFITFTNKLIEYNIVLSDKLAERGYQDVYDFAERYVDESYFNQAQSQA